MKSTPRCGHLTRDGNPCRYYADHPSRYGHVSLQAFKARRSKRKSEGLCRSCRELAVPGMVNCAKCAAHAAAGGRRRRAALIAQGWCGSCARNPLSTASYCAACAVLHTLHKALWDSKVAEEHDLKKLTELQETRRG